MSSSKGENTTFDPMDWYKKMTTCLANKKNCKINLSRVPGGKEIKERKLPPKITNQNLQDKFLSKYNEKRQQQDSEDIANNESKSSSLAFNLKQKDQASKNDGKKRQKPDESFINLPPQYFKANVPDLSIFKVPEAPVAKKQKIQDVGKDTTNNFTLESLFSGNFKPGKASTPFDEQPTPSEANSKPKSAESINKEPRQAESVSMEPRPIISDPGDFLGGSKVLGVQAFENFSASLQEEDEEDPKFKEFEALVDEAAKQTDSCFSHIPDPMVDVINRLNNVHDIATQSPRKSLFSESELSPQAETPVKSNRPVPVFYEKPEGQTEDNSVFCKTVESLPSFSCSRAAEFDDVMSMLDFNIGDGAPTSIDFLFETPPRRKPISEMIDGSILFTRPTRARMEFNWLDEVFNDFNDSFDHEGNGIGANTTSGHIFQSPPSQRSRRSELQRKFSQAVDASRDDHDVSNSSSIWSDHQEDPFPIEHNEDVSVFDLFDL